MKMKEIRMFLLLVAMVAVIDSCTKTETKTSVATTNGTLLAGASGQSKSWTLKTFSVSANGSAAQAVTGIPACESDNIYKFSNNSTQSYQNTEGTAVCTSGDPTTIESGSWAFTDDGKTLLIDGTNFITSNEANSSDHFLVGNLVLTQTGPLGVAQITDSSLTLTYSFAYNSTNYVITIVLGKV